MADVDKEGTPPPSDPEVIGLMDMTGSEEEATSAAPQPAGSRRWKLPETDEPQLVKTDRSTYIKAVLLVANLLPVFLDHLSDVPVLMQLIAMERY